MRYLAARRLFVRLRPYLWYGEVEIDDERKMKKKQFNQRAYLYIITTIDEMCFWWSSLVKYSDLALSAGNQRDNYLIRVD